MKLSTHSNRRQFADRLCRACLTTDYPTPAGERMYQIALRNHDTGGDDGRTYELGPRCG